MDDVDPHPWLPDPGSGLDVLLTVALFAVMVVWIYRTRNRKWGSPQ
jgi:hypothetical protein